jgi:hypothetical protein
MKSKQIDGGTCPTCGKTLDGLTNPVDDDLDMHPGDISICFYCGTILVFNEELQLVPCTDEYLNDLDEAPRELLFQIRESILKRLN